MKTEELVKVLSDLKERYVQDLIKGGAYSEWNKGILAGKIDCLDEIIGLVSK